MAVSQEESPPLPRKRQSFRTEDGEDVNASQPWLAVATVLAWGAVAFGNVPALQVYVVRQAERHAPQAADGASGLNIAAFNAGIAGGAWAGGLIVARLGLLATPWTGALVVPCALAPTTLAGWLERKGSSEESTARRDAAAAH